MRICAPVGLPVSLHHHLVQVECEPSGPIVSVQLCQHSRSLCRFECHRLTHSADFSTGCHSAHSRCHSQPLADDAECIRRCVAALEAAAAALGSAHHLSVKAGAANCRVRCCQAQQANPAQPDTVVLSIGGAIAMRPLHLPPSRQSMSS